jgi:hypothetical protein
MARKSYVFALFVLNTDGVENSFYSEMQVRGFDNEICRKYVPDASKSQ